MIVTDLVLISAWCPFCGTKFEFHQHKKKKKKPRYFCCDGCREDYRALHDPRHPNYREVVNRQLKLKGSNN